jgi:hypothetical protein
MVRVDGPSATDQLMRQRQLRTALFVDFDNVYSGLRDLDADLAERFATDPVSWVANLDEGTFDGVTFARRFLVRNCYLNPSTFARYRAFWTRAGFRVVDCPSLTQQGKSSTDINLVLDAVDALDYSTKYDEFIIASADADFTSLVHRCRAADRLVTVITAGPVAGAYRAVADMVLEADHLTELSLTAQARDDDTAPRHSLDGAPSDGAVVSPDVRVQEAQPASSGREPTAAHEAVRRAVRAARGPITGGATAHAARSADPELTNRWGTHPNFGAWMAHEVPDVGYSSRPSPGYAWDRARFSEADLPRQDEDQLSVLQRQVARVTDVPALSREDYRIVIKTLANDVSARPFDRTETSKRVRDECQAQGAAVGRSAINFVIQGLLYSGANLAGSPTAAELAEGWTANVVGLCRGARMEIDSHQLDDLRTWVGGGLVT